MMIYILFILVFLPNIIFSSVPPKPGSTIQCYKCDSFRSSACEKPGPNIPKCSSNIHKSLFSTSTNSTNFTWPLSGESLSQNQHGCYKLSITVKNHPVIFRDCTNDNCDTLKKKIRASYPGANINSCHICQKNLCNTGDEVRSALLLVATAALFSMYANKQLY